MIEAWKTRLINLDKETRTRLTRIWLQMEHELEPAMLVYEAEPLWDAARTALKRTIPLLEREIIQTARVTSEWGAEAGADITGRAFVAKPLAWRNDLEKVPRESLAGLQKASSVHGMRNGLAKGFLRVLGVGRDFPMDAFRGSIQQGDGPWTRMSVFAPNTCIACILLDGTVYEVLGEFSDHPHGWCYVVQDPKDFLFREKGIDWFLNLTDEEQIEILGPEYWQAWQDGCFGIMELILYTAEGYAIVKPLWRAKDSGSESGVDSD